MSRSSRIPSPQRRARAIHIAIAFLCSMSALAGASASPGPAPDRVRVLSSFGASDPRHVPAPKELRFEISATAWAGEPNLPFERTDTLVVRVARGDDLDGPREYGGWQFRRGGPFVLGTIIDAENAWVRFSEVVPAIGGGRGIGADSVLVSTVWRSFYTPTVDAGIGFQIRIASGAGGVWDRAGMQVFRRGPHLGRHAIFDPRSRPIVGRGLVAGILRRADSGEPVRDARVSLRGLPHRTLSTAAGRFELGNVPIGHRVLVVQDRCGEAHATIEVTDEEAESLDVVVSCVEPLPRIEAAQARGEPAWPNRRVDVWPLRMGGAPPTYPAEARRRGFEGDVHVRTWIDSLGLVRYARIERSAFPDVDASAQACVRKWRFRPALVSGRPVPCVMVVPVHFSHPQSPELVPLAGLRSTSGTSDSRRGRDPAISVEVSARLDSVTNLYSYSYRLTNLGRTTLIAAFALQPVVGEIEDLGPPQGWNCFVGCGGSYDVVGCMAWGHDRGDQARDQMILPGETIEGFGFKSRLPPGRIRWFARPANRDSIGDLPWPFGSSDVKPMIESPLQGVTTGPVPAGRAGD